MTCKFLRVVFCILLALMLNACGGGGGAAMGGGSGSPTAGAATTPSDAFSVGVTISGLILTDGSSMP